MMTTASLRPPISSIEARGVGAQFSFSPHNRLSMGNRRNPHTDMGRLINTRLKHTIDDGLGEVIVVEDVTHGGQRRLVGNKQHLAAPPL